MTQSDAHRYEDRIRLYEIEKQSWMARNPEATPTEYEQAMRRIASALGI